MSNVWSGIGGKRERITPFMCLQLMSEARLLADRLDATLAMYEWNRITPSKMEKLARICYKAEKRLQDRQAMWKASCHRVMPPSAREKAYKRNS